MSAIRDALTCCIDFCERYPRRCQQNLQAASDPVWFVMQSVSLLHVSELQLLSAAVAAVTLAVVDISDVLTVVLSTSTARSLEFSSLVVVSGVVVSETVTALALADGVV